MEDNPKLNRCCFASWENEKHRKGGNVFLCLVLSTFSTSERKRKGMFEKFVLCFSADGCALSTIELHLTSGSEAAKPGSLIPVMLEDNDLLALQKDGSMLLQPDCIYDILSCGYEEYTSVSPPLPLVCLRLSICHPSRWWR